MEIESYKLSEILSIVSEFERDQIFLQTVLKAITLIIWLQNKQKIILIFHMKINLTTE